MGTGFCVVEAQAALSRRPWILERWDMEGLDGPHQPASPPGVWSAPAWDPAYSLRPGVLLMRSGVKPIPAHLPMQALCGRAVAPWLLPPKSCVEWMSPGPSVAVRVPQQQALVAGQHMSVVVLHHAAHTCKQNLTFQVELRVLQKGRRYHA